MRLTRRGRIGLVFIAIGLMPLAAWTLWFQTRSWCPVNMPVSLSEGSHFTTGVFTINLNAQYEITIESENKIPLEKLECLLGSRPAHTCQVAPVIKIDWTLSGNGASIHGTSDDTAAGWGGSGPSGEAFRTIGLFSGKKGRQYKLDFDVRKDGSSLAITNPRLKVSEADTQYESGLVLSGLLRYIGGVLALLGGGILLGSLWQETRRPKETSPTENAS